MNAYCTEIKRIIKKICEQLYAHNLNSMDTMYKLLERHKVQSESVRNRNQNRPVTSEEIEFVIKKIPMG